MSRFDASREVIRDLSELSSESFDVDDDFSAAISDSKDDRTVSE